ETFGAPAAVPDVQRSFPAPGEPGSPWSKPLFEEKPFPPMVRYRGVCQKEVASGTLGAPEEGQLKTKCTLCPEGLLPGQEKMAGVVPPLGLILRMRTEIARELPAVPGGRSLKGRLGSDLSSGQEVNSKKE